ncbi:MAG: hypothetical protein LBP61_08910 [Desulfovibrio sp.]|jgi:hypothetical protein|nr:hypothetical protein [Desulfovibrio sp.]
MLSLYFDAKDHELLTMVNSILDSGVGMAQGSGRVFFPSAMHPHGLKELSMSQEIRVAYAVINLLDTLDTGQAQDRIEALRALRAEVLAAPSSSFRYNTARVLIQIMKDLVRAHGNTAAQLRLAHDFRAAATGNRLVVRRMLRQYHLLEMPETWDQLAFDHHVHDANTKGRKSPTQLIMDAWIKGLRTLDVVYYNFVEAAAVAELLQAAEIMGITVRVGIEFQPRFRDRFVQIVWQPRGFEDWHDMLAFFQGKDCQDILALGREASLYHHTYVMRLLEQYNTRLRLAIGEEWGLELEEISEREILAFVAIGQTSRTHLAELIYRRIMTAFAAGMDSLRARYLSADAAGREEMDRLLARINALTPESVNAQWLQKAKNPAVPLATDPEERDRVPEIMRRSPADLVNSLTALRSTSNIILNLCDLAVEDVLELLYDCEGKISHLEIFNLKNYEDGRLRDIPAISELQFAVNEGSGISLKRLLRNLLTRIGDRPLSSPEDDRARNIREILRHLAKFQSFYARRPLKTRIGSDSISRSPVFHGMGFAYAATLPNRERLHLSDQKDEQRKYVPYRQVLRRLVSYIPREHPPLGGTLTRLLRALPGLENIGKRKETIWEVDEKSFRYDPTAREIIALGGSQAREHIFQCAPHPDGERRPDAPQWRYMNTSLKNIAKVLLGFSLTLLTFLHTQTWWFLAYCGPLIWFGITGGRNIIQAVLGGGGFQRASLLRWNDYISWSRLCDSLMYTGFSVPLLELGVRLLLLEKGLGVTSLNAPVFLYTTMALINGLYIASHNRIRGFPREAIVGNLFRSVLAIPVSVTYSYLLLQIFLACGWPVIILTQAATVISKLASDTVAAVIEGFADKAEFSRRRDWDYQDKLFRLFSTFSRLEMALPEKDVLELLREQWPGLEEESDEVREMERTLAINSLDIMYFWFYQPRARSSLTRWVESMSRDEKEIFAACQGMLTRVRPISQMLMDGLVGNNFARALGFYLSRYEAYLRDMSRLTGVASPAGTR